MGWLFWFLFFLVLGFGFSGLQVGHHRAGKPHPNCYQLAFVVRRQPFTSAILTASRVSSLMPTSDARAGIFCLRFQQTAHGPTKGWKVLRRQSTTEIKHLLFENIWQEASLIHCYTYVSLRNCCLPVIQLAVHLAPLSQT